MFLKIIQVVTIDFKQVDNSSLDSETRKRIEKGWLNNAYNE